MYYAKSNPIESINTHTNSLLERLEILKNKYGDKIVDKITMNEERFWYLMEIICKYHDYGKVYTGFQNLIRKNLGEEILNDNFDNRIKHEKISPIFVPRGDLSKDERKLVYQVIYYHHERDDDILINYDVIEKIVKEDIIPNFDKINDELNLDIKSDDISLRYLGMVHTNDRFKEGDKLYYDYCLMKGLLHRLDHCSSAHLEIEDVTNECVSDFVEDFMKEKGYSLNHMQDFVKSRRDDNLVIIGSTGLGKTESALLWTGGDKAFFTLPLRISINAIYDRIKEIILYKHVGLLHSSALDYIEEKSRAISKNEIEIEDEIEKINQSKNLASKLTTSTIDQIFTFALKYKGYEKMYATLKYSKIIIDEIQAYSPEIVAIIIKGLEMINNIGGKFMIMTATLPRIYKDELEKREISFEFEQFIKDTQRHRLKLINSEIDDYIDNIIDNSKDKKVLVIVNTVNKAIIIYKTIMEKIGDRVNLLHSRFIFDDRNDKEKRIKEFSNECNANGIWITTQIVEASIDIDFDILYTEMSTLDSLFQRMGRCYRSREYFKEDANVIVFTGTSNGVGTIYDKEINRMSIELLSEYDNLIIDEKSKIELVDKLYSKEKLKGTKFYKDFVKAIDVINNIQDYELSKNEAQKIIRKIDNIDVIPRSVYDNNIEVFDEYDESKDLLHKADLKKRISKLFISINKNNLYIRGNKLTECTYLKGKYIIDDYYDDMIGLVLSKDDEIDISAREL